MAFSCFLYTNAGRLAAQHLVLGWGWPCPFEAALGRGVHASPASSSRGLPSPAHSCPLGSRGVGQETELHVSVALTPHIMTCPPPVSPGGSPGGDVDPFHYGKPGAPSAGPEPPPAPLLGAQSSPPWAMTPPSPGMGQRSASWASEKGDRNPPSLPLCLQTMRPSAKGA